MDERVQKLLESVQQTAVAVGSAASDAAYGATRRAGELLSVAKLNIRLTELRSAADDALREIGALIYATHTGDPTDSDVLLEKLRGIDELNARIAEAQAQLRALRGSTCPRCGGTVHPGDAYCGACGRKL